MKKYILIGILSFFVQCVFAQEDTAAQLVYQDTVVTEIRISSENDTNTNVQSSLPMMLQQHTQKSGLPSVTNIAAEVPNDTVKPKVTFKVVPTEKTIPDEPDSAEKPVAAQATKSTAASTSKQTTTAVSKTATTLKTTTASTRKPATTTASASAAGRTYKVQVCAMQNPTPQALADLKNRLGQKTQFATESDKGMKKYVVGSFKTYDEAAKLRDSLREKGFKGAFVVTYNNGHRE